MKKIKNKINYLNKKIEKNKEQIQRQTEKLNTIINLFNKNNTTKWVAVLGIVISISSLVISYTTFYFNAYKDAPTIIHGHIYCPKEIQKNVGDLISIGLMNYGNSWTQYNLSIVGEGFLLKESNIAGYVSEETLNNEYVSKLNFPYSIGPKDPDSYIIHIYPNTTLEQIKITAKLHYKTFSKIPLPFFDDIEYNILNCPYNTSITDIMYHLMEIK